MDIRQFEALTQKLEKAKEDKIRLEGSLNQIMEQLKSDFGVSSLEEAERLQNKLESELESDEKKLEEYTKEIENMIDWNSI